MKSRNIKIKEPNPTKKAPVSFFVQHIQEHCQDIDISRLNNLNNLNDLDLKSDLSLNFFKIKKNSVAKDQDEICDDSDSSDDDKKSKCNLKGYEFLIRLFVNLGYYICLIPFRFCPVVVGQTRYFEIRQNGLQHIICILFNFTATFVCFTVAIAQIGGQQIEKNPLVIFNFWSYSVFCGWCFIFANLFWRKQHVLLAIVNKEQRSLNGNCGGNSHKWLTVFATLYFFGVIVEEMYHKSVFYLWPKVYGMQSAAEVYTGKALYALLMRNNSDPVPWPQITKTHLTISVWHFVGWQIFGEIKSLFYIFVTFNSIFLIGKIKRHTRLLREAKRLKIGQKLDSQMIWDHFVEVRGTVDRINELSDLPVLGIYLILVPFLSSSLIQRWDSDFIEYKILMVLQFVWPMIALVYASEATRMGEIFMTLVKDKNESLDQKNGKMGSAYFVYENASLAIRGGKFFKLSYGFLGTTLSVIMTYGLVILGFLHDDHIKTARKSKKTQKKQC